MVTDEELVRRAFEVAKPRKLSKAAGAATVGSALVTDKGTVYIGVCIDTACSMGFCAEHNAIGNMVTNGESRIMSIVAVNYEGKILSPCGRCREFIWQMDHGNAATRILLKDSRVVALQELLPESWLFD